LRPVRSGLNGLTTPAVFLFDREKRGAGDQGARLRQLDWWGLIHMQRTTALFAIGLFTACASDNRDTDYAPPVTTTDGDEPDDGDTGGSNDDSGGSADDEAGDDGGDGDGDGPGIKFDTEADDIDHNGGDNEAGCDKVDFLFVVDNSGSMVDEQQNLINSFPGFISEIQQTLMAQDYQILVADTDAGGGGGCLQSVCCNVNCNQWCASCQAQGCTCQCNGQACPAVPNEECDETLGAGKTESSAGADCGIEGGSRYMVDGQPDLADTFACVAVVGTGGDGNERPMEASIEAVTSLIPQGKCNEGFLRDDAILVVTVITDEEDLQKSMGDPASWKQALVAAKNGNEKAVVPLALVGDSDMQQAVCPPYDQDGAEGAPRLRQWAESFPYGSWGSVCTPDYTDFFHDAVSVIDTACDDFIPEG
jgi:hypothetical protein